MQHMQVKVPGGPAQSYPVVIGSGLLPTLWPQIKATFADRHRFLITDEHVVAAGHMDALLAGRQAPHFVITPAGEASKNIDTAVAIIEEMEKACLGRDTVVVALGGGTVGDVAGFAAAIFKRGVPVVQIPTTTLAQADSAIGGKTGVDSSISKNAFGAFWHPAAVYVDVDTLRTLDERQYRAGLVESIKHGLIADAEYFEFIERQLDAILNREPDILATMARYNCAIKGRVVEEDPQERNRRRSLNYGHTIGHAVEAAGGYALLHGEAVALGIVAAGLIEGVRKVLTTPSFWPAAAWFFFNCAIFFSFGGLWGGPYLMQVYGFSKGQAGHILSMLAIGMIVGSPILSYLSNNVFHARKPVMVLSGLITLMLSALLAFYTDKIPPAGLYALCLGMGCFTSAIVVVAFTITKELFPVQIAGTATGLVNLFPFAGGAVFQPVLGYVLESRGRTGEAFTLAGYQQAFLVLFFCGVIAFLSSLLLKETLTRE